MFGLQDYEFHWKEMDATDTSGTPQGESRMEKVHKHQEQTNEHHAENTLYKIEGTRERGDDK